MTGAMRETSSGNLQLSKCSPATISGMLPCRDRRIDHEHDQERSDVPDIAQAGSPQHFDILALPKVKYGDGRRREISSGGIDSYARVKNKENVLYTAKET